MMAKFGSIRQNLAKTPAAAHDFLRLASNSDKDSISKPFFFSGQLRVKLAMDIN
ncbi:hypothetical protein WN943_014268 [Citrus x changshan-huyou]